MDRPRGAKTLRGTQRVNREGGERWPTNRHAPGRDWDSPLSDVGEDRRRNGTTNSVCNTTT